MLIDLGWFMRTVHIIAATAWVGGSITYQFIVIPALRIASPTPTVATEVAQLFKRLVNYCIGILLVTGVYLMFDRLTQTTLGLPYLIVLGIKIVAALGMFVLALYMAQSNIRRLAKRSTRLSKAAPQLMLALGICIFVLGALLNHLFELAIAPH
jgi:putative copper export protein